MTFLERILEAILIKAFLRELIDNIKNEVTVLEPTTLEQIRDWAEKKDQKWGTATWVDRRNGGGGDNGRRYGGSIGGGQFQPKRDPKEKKSQLYFSQIEP